MLENLWTSEPSLQIQTPSELIEMLKSSLNLLNFKVK